MCRMPTNSSRVLWESRTIQIIEPICSTAGSPISITNETMPGFLTTSESSAAVHGSFDDLQPVDLPLDCAPRQRQGGMHGIAILTKAASEALEAPVLSGRDPAVQLVGQALLDHGRERPGQVDRLGDRRRQLK